MKEKTTLRATILTALTRKDLVMAGLAVVAAWVIFGGLLYTGDSALHEVVEQSSFIGGLSWGFTGAILLSTGIYQFTGWKQNCLQAGHTACLPSEGLSGGGPTLIGWRLGWKHGIYCLGSCWGLMLVMFAIGWMNLAVMPVFLALMAAERFVRFRRHATILIGLTFVVWGIAGLLVG